MGNQAKCIIAEDLPRNKKVKHIHKKKQNHLKLIFISRICKMKNLLGAIQIISNLTEFPIQFDIYGNIEDKEYWELCKIELEKLPINVKWQYRGECDSNKVVETFANYDIFLFPTLGENFGHVISEALLAGCIPVISKMCIRDRRISFLFDLKCFFGTITSVLKSDGVVEGGTGELHKRDGDPS